jgi:glycosyltransferase involved in cell wall biosynthesis
MVLYGDLTFDSRVQREASTLAEAGYDVRIFTLVAEDVGLDGLDPRVRVVVTPPDAGGVVPGSVSPGREGGAPRLPGAMNRLRWVAGYVRTLRSWGRRVVDSAPDVDVWHAHDFAGLVAVASIGSRQRLVYDVHDLFLETGMAILLPSPLRSLVRRYEGRLARRADLIVAANAAYGEVIQTRYRTRKPVAIHNCPPIWQPPVPRPNLLREAAGLAPNAPVVLYHGIIGGNRGIEILCDAILRPELATAHLFLLGFGLDIERFRAMAHDSRLGGRLHVLDAVPPSELLPWVASADVGVMVFPRATLNLELTTPNKLFECLAAGTPVVISDFPGMRRIVLADPGAPLGATCDPADVAAVAGAIASMIEASTAPDDALRRRCLVAAHERWNWEVEARRLADAYARLDVDPGIGRSPA